MNVRGPAKPRAVLLSRHGFYRWSRMLHAYISAIAFVALIFFSATGVLLNHPDWFRGEPAAAKESTLQLAQSDVDAALLEADPAAALAALVRMQATPSGGYASGEIADGIAFLHFAGASGASDVEIDLASGRAGMTVKRADTVAVLHELHRGTKTGPEWRTLIDVTAYVVLALSLVGYILFFSLRFRLRTSLALTALSLGSMLAVFLIFVP